MKTRTGLQLRGGGVLPVENGGTGSTDLEDITVGKALGDGDGNNIKSTYSTKSEALRTATYTLQGQVKMGSTTNGGNITSGDSDDVVPTIKNICDWVKNNMLPSTGPSWVSGRVDSIKLPNTGWYYIEINGVLNWWHSTGVFYWDGTITCLPVSAHLRTGTVIWVALVISTDGSMSLFNPIQENPVDITSRQVKYYKLA